jgi:signal transduction histidine kinase
MKTTPSDLVLITTSYGRLQFVSPNVERLLGYSVEQVYRQRYISALLGEGGLALPSVGAVIRSLHCTVLDGDGNSRNLLVTVQRSHGWGRSLLYICREATDDAPATYSPQQVERERLLAMIIRRVRQSLDLDWILHSTVQEVQDFLQTDRVLIYRFASDWSGQIIVEAVAHPWRSTLGEDTDDPCFRSDYVKLYQEGRVKATNDIYTSGFAPCHIKTLEGFQVRASLVVPILYGEQLWGLLVAHHCTAPRHWQPWEINLIRQLADQVAIALQQSELYQKLQNLNATLEAQVEARTAELQRALQIEALLKRITDKVRDSLDEQHILATAVAELAQGLAVNSCDAALYDLDRQISTISYEAVQGMPAASGTQISMPDYAAIYDQLLRGLDMQLCWTANTPERPSGGKASALACPIMDDRGVMGDLWLYRLDGQEFSDQEIRLVRQVANQGAIALRQARLYKAAQAQVEELKRLNQLKEDFVSTVSHELRTPMSSISMATQMLEIALKQTSGELDNREQIHQYLNILRDECQREMSLINDLLDLQRLDAGTEPLTVTTIQLQVWVPHAVEPLEPRIRAQRQKLIVQIEPDLPPFTTDITSLERVLTELLTNACKYSPAGETIVVQCQRIVEAGDKPAAVQLMVTNTGVEISPAEQVRIFEKFYRIPNMDPWKFSGTGLGLALVKKLVAYLGGSIQVTSQNRSVAFTVVLPDRLSPS